MEPEIARRCQECGASVRNGSLFCPQCGRPLKAGVSSVESAARAAPETTALRKTDAGEREQASDSSARGPEAASDAPPAQTAPPAPAEQSVADNVGQRAEAVSSASSDSAGDGRSARQRVTAAARDVVEEKLSPRVEKLRHASNVMLEEATYDPSLRFVLVALAVILLSLLLLLLNYLLG